MADTAGPSFAAIIRGAGKMNGRPRRCNTDTRISCNPIGNRQWWPVANLDGLHSRTGDPASFIDEKGNLVNGQWTGSPSPVQHDFAIN